MRIKMNPRRICIKIKEGPGVKAQYVPVHVPNLSLSTITELYTWDPATKQYKVAQGMETQVNTGLDISELLEHWNDLREQIDVYLTPTAGIAGELSIGLRDFLDNLPKLLQALAQGKVAEAWDPLGDMGYRLMGTVAKTVGALKEIEKESTAQSGLAEAALAAMEADDVDGFYANTAEATATRIDDGLRALRKLEAYEKELDRLVDELSEKAANWATNGTMPAWLAEHINWLDWDEDGFCRRASLYIIQPDEKATEKMAYSVLEAEEKIAKIRSTVSAQLSEQKKAREKAEGVLANHTDIDRWISTVRNAREVVRQNSDAKIDAFYLAKGLITSEEHQEWQQRQAQNSRWASPYEVGSRLREKVETIRRLLGQTPKLSPEVEAIISRSESYMERLIEPLAANGVDLRSEKAEPEAKASAAVAPAPQTKPAATPVATAAVSAPKQALAGSQSAAAQASLPPGSGSTINSNRLEEIYEMVLGVAAVKYCGRPQDNLLGGTAEAFLDILCRMEKITAEEKGPYAKALKQKIEAQTRPVTKGENKSQIWKASRMQWIKFLSKRGRSTTLHPLWRLTEKTRTKGMEMCKKHGMKRADIESAFEARRTEADLKRQQYRKDKEE
jgi:hypothetical protein